MGNALQHHNVDDLGAFAPAVAQLPDLAGIDVKELARPLAPLFDKFRTINDARRG